MYTILTRRDKPENIEEPMCAVESAYAAFDPMKLNNIFITTISHGVYSERFRGNSFKLRHLKKSEIHQQVALNYNKACDLEIYNTARNYLNNIDNES